MHRELRAASRRVVHVYGTLLPFDRGPDQTEAESCALDPLGTRLFTAIERFENTFEFRFRNARTAIADPDLHTIGKSRRRNSDPLASGAVAHGITDQVAKNQLEGDRIAHHGGQLRSY